MSGNIAIKHFRGADDNVERSKVSTYRSRNIPWLQVVRFHKEIVLRAEQSFFSLDGRNDQSERWTSLSGFAPRTLSGPWKANIREFTSKRFRLAFEQRQIESVFLGGPCYVAWERSRNGQMEPYWRALLYKEVELHKEGENFEIIPKQGTWSVNPLFQVLLNRLELTVPTSLDHFVVRIMESATQLGVEKHTLSELIWKVLENELPEVVQDLRRAQRRVTFPTQPSPWVLFAPSTTYSPLVQNLIADYERLEKRIEKDKSDIGGLRILEEFHHENGNSQVELLPIVPLNESQSRAVKAALEGYPLTVISGPPGTGKSQVVVALLLNAWARGQTVLLASNNNKAVDVVRERLERFESDFPISVRAGSRQNQRIQETLRQVLNKAGTVRRSRNSLEESARIRQRRQKLIDEVGILKKQVRTEIPRQIDEAFEAALNSYGECRRILDRFEHQEDQFRRELLEIGIVDRAAEAIEQDLLATKWWLGKAAEYQSLAEQGEQRRQVIQHQIEEKTSKRDAIIRKLGVRTTDPTVNWGWLISYPIPEKLIEWEETAQKLLIRIDWSHLQLQPWDVKYQRWTDAREAEISATRLCQFRNRILETCNQLRDDVEIVRKLENKLDESLFRLHEIGGSSDIDVAPELLAQWVELFAEYITLENRLLDNAPWSHRTKLLKELKRIEGRIRPGVPLDVWLRIGQLDDAGRRRLATIVEHTQQWYSNRENWQAIQHVVHDIDKSLQELRALALTLGIESAPSGRDLDSWTAVILICEEEAGLANQAAGYWNRVSEKELVEKRLTNLAEDWSTLVSSHLISESWRRVRGTKFDTEVKELLFNPSEDVARSVIASISSGIVRTLTIPWIEARARHKEIVDLEVEARSIPTPQMLLDSWWSERPEQALVLNSCPENLASISESLSELNPLIEWLARWTHHNTINRITAENEARPHMQRAIIRLEQVRNLIPSPEIAKKFEHTKEIIEDSIYEVWPVEEISRMFLPFGAAEMSRRVERMEAEIERSSFDLAKSNWLERLRVDVDAVRNVDALEALLSKHYGKLPDGNSDIFRTALRVAPIWITTAQAPQAVPLEPDLFDIVVIDEASQCTVTNLLPLLYRGKSLVILGDDKQLPAIATIQETEEATLAQRFQVEHFLYLIGHTENDVYRAATQSLPGRRGDVITLTDHYRSHPLIIGFSNRHIYTQQLELKKDPDQNKRLPLASGVHRRSVQGYARRGDYGQSWINEPEADMVLQLINEITNYDHRSLSLGVVTPFAAQKEYLRARVDGTEFANNVLIDSAYGFQGDERDVIIFSPVVARGITESACRWVQHPPNLINVAITRAREALIVVADFDYCLRLEGMLRELARYCNDIQRLRESSQAELELFSWMMLKGLNPHVHPRIGDLEVDFGLRTRSGRRLVVEIDGNQHQNTGESDKARDAFLNAQGCFVIRIPARDVFETPISVMHNLLSQVND